MHRLSFSGLLSAALVFSSTPATAEDDTELAKQLSNPVSSLVSVPFQFNYDSGYGPDGNGHRTTVNFQPVVPIRLNDDWNLISRSIVPFIDQSDIRPGTSQSGVGDIVQSFFISPNQRTESGLIWGAGPVFLLPTGDDGLGADQFAAGLTGVVLKQTGPWTFGVLANHMWDVGGGSDPTDISATFVQPFINYTTPDAVTFAVLLDAEQQPFGSVDRYPAGFYSPMLWADGEIVPDSFTVPVRPDAPPGIYHLHLGL